MMNLNETFKNIMMEYTEPNSEWLKNKIIKAMGDSAEIEDEETDDNIKTFYISNASDYDDCFMALDRIFNSVIKKNFNISNWDLEEETNSNEYQYKLVIVYGAPLNESHKENKQIDEAVEFFERSLFDWNINLASASAKKLKDFILKTINGFGTFKINIPIEDGDIIDGFLKFKYIMIDSNEDDDFSHSYNVYINVEDSLKNNMNCKIGLITFYEDSSFKMKMFKNSKIFKIESLG